MAEIKFKLNTSDQSVTLSEDGQRLITLSVEKLQAFVLSIPIIHYLINEGHAKDFISFIEGKAGFGDVQMSIPQGLQVTFTRQEGLELARFVFNSELPHDILEMGLSVMHKLMENAVALEEFLVNGFKAKASEKPTQTVNEETDV